MTRAEPIDPALIPEWLAIVKRKAEGLQFGAIQIVVHNNRVTQIECTEKTRFDAAPAERSRLRGDD